MDNFVITIARQYGSGGRTVGENACEEIRDWILRQGYYPHGI